MVTPPPISSQRRAWGKPRSALLQGMILVESLVVQQPTKPSTGMDYVFTCRSTPRRGESSWASSFWALAHYR